MSDNSPVLDHTNSNSSQPLRISREGGWRTTVGFIRSAFDSLENAPKRADMILTSLFGVPTVVLAHPSLISQVLTDTKGVWIKDRMTRRASDVFGDGLLLSEGDIWKRQRKILNPGFSSVRFDAYASVMRDRTAVAVANWPDQGRIDVASEMARLTLDVAVRTLFGADIAESNARRVSEAFSAVSDFFASPLNMLPFSIPKWLPLPLIQRYVRAVAELDSVLNELISMRRSKTQSGEDLLSMLLSSRDESGGFSDREVRDQAVTFLLAGHETTALGLTFALFELGRRPDLRARLFAEVDAADLEVGIESLPFTTQVIKESLRLYPPAYALSRENTGDVTLGGLLIKKGSVVVASPWALHRDARWHANPLEFRPERWTPEYEKTLPSGAYFPFGMGPRKCIGSRFAMIEAVLLLTGIARRFDWNSIDKDLPPLQPTLTCRPTKPVWVTVQERNSY